MPQYLHEDNELACRAWKFCDLAGRDTQGRIRGDVLLDTVRAYDGTQDDISRIFRLEKIKQRLSGEHKKAGGNEEDRG